MRIPGSAIGENGERENAVIDHCKVRLGGVKAPKSVEFWAELPKTAAGKLDRKTIRGPYWVGTDRAVR